MKKLFCIDTNVLLADSNSVNAFGSDNTVVIPLAVLEELDRQKSRQDDVGRAARHVARMLDELRAQGDLMTGVKLDNGGTLMIALANEAILSTIPFELREVGKVDNLIIAQALQLTRENPAESVVLVSRDINVRIKCEVLGIKCQDYLNMRVVDDAKKLYRGVEVVSVDSTAVVDSAHNGLLKPSDIGDQKFFPNQIVVVKYDDGMGSKQTALTRYDQKTDRLKRCASHPQVFGLKPRNKEQIFALDMLMDPEIKLVTLVGSAGVGKTLIAMAAGLAQLDGTGDTKLYDKLIVSRPIQPLGKDIGFLPGTLQEKMEPWVSPIKDNLEQLGLAKRRPAASRSPGGTSSARDDQSSYLSLLMASGKIEIEAITFIRGRSIPNAFIVIDEAQNLTLHELKTIITRAGENSKIVLTGDIEQIDNVHVDIYTNGLTCAVEKFKTQPIAGHVTLLKGERSQLATIAAQIL